MADRKHGLGNNPFSEWLRTAGSMDRLILAWHAVCAEVGKHKKKKVFALMFAEAARLLGRQLGIKVLDANTKPFAYFVRACDQTYFSPFHTEKGGKVRLTEYGFARLYVLMGDKAYRTDVMEKVARLRCLLTSDKHMFQLWWLGEGTEDITPKPGSKPEKRVSRKDVETGIGADELAKFFDGLVEIGIVEIVCSDPKGPDGRYIYRVNKQLFIEVVSFLDLVLGDKILHISVPDNQSVTLMIEEDHPAPPRIEETDELDQLSQNLADATAKVEEAERALVEADAELASVKMQIAEARVNRAVERIKDMNLSVEELALLAKTLAQ